jgi:hypothetical protein
MGPSAAYAHAARATLRAPRRVRDEARLHGPLTRLAPAAVPSRGSKLARRSARRPRPIARRLRRRQRPTDRVAMNARPAVDLALRKALHVLHPPDLRPLLHAKQTFLRVSIDRSSPDHGPGRTDPRPPRRWPRIRPAQAAQYSGGAYTDDAAGADRRAGDLCIGEDRAARRWLGSLIRRFGWLDSRLLLATVA